MASGQPFGGTVSLPHVPPVRIGAPVMVLAAGRNNKRNATIPPLPHFTPHRPRSSLSPGNVTSGARSDPAFLPLDRVHTFVVEPLGNFSFGGGHPDEADHRILVPFHHQVLPKARVDDMGAQI